MLRPLHDKVLVKEIEGEGKTEGGIYIPDSVEKKLTKGRVMAVGAKTLYKSVKINDIILFRGKASKVVVIEGEDFLIVREADVLATVEP